MWKYYSTCTDLCTPVQTKWQTQLCPQWFFCTPSEVIQSTHLYPCKRLPVWSFDPYENDSVERLLKCERKFMHITTRLVAGKALRRHAKICKYALRQRTFFSLNCCSVLLKHSMWFFSGWLVCVADSYECAVTGLLTERPSLLRTTVFFSDGAGGYLTTEATTNVTADVCHVCALEQSRETQMLDSSREYHRCFLTTCLDLEFRLKNILLTLIDCSTKCKNTAAATSLTHVAVYRGQGASSTLLIRWEIVLHITMRWINFCLCSPAYLYRQRWTHAYPTLASSMEHASMLVVTMSTVHAKLARPATDARQVSACSLLITFTPLATCFPPSIIQLSSGIFFHTHCSR